MDQQTMALQGCYDRVAEEYAERCFYELGHKLLDRKLLDQFAERVKDLEPACEK